MPRWLHVAGIALVIAVSWPACSATPVPLPDASAPDALADAAGDASDILAGDASADTATDAFACIPASVAPRPFCDVEQRGCAECLFDVDCNDLAHPNCVQGSCQNIQDGIVCDADACHCISDLGCASQPGSCCRAGGCEDQATCQGS
jgi:hypothetical protein